MTAYTAFGQSLPPGGGVDGGSGIRTWGLLFEVSAAATLDASWWYSPPGAPSLPAWCGLYDAVAQTILAQDASPSWSGAAGSGWVRCPLPGSLALSPGSWYMAAAAFNDETGSTWQTAGYWDSGGAGFGGIVSGPLTIPDDAQAVAAGFPGQGPIAGSSVPTFPHVPISGSNWWVDIEVSGAAVASSLLMASII